MAKTPERCPTCDSDDPALHGWINESTTCADPFHDESREPAKIHPAAGDQPERRYWICPECFDASDEPFGCGGPIGAGAHRDPETHRERPVEAIEVVAASHLERVVAGFDVARRRREQLKVERDEWRESQQTALRTLTRTENELTTAEARNDALEKALRVCRDALRLYTPPASGRTAEAIGHLVGPFNAASGNAGVRAIAEADAALDTPPEEQ